MRMQRSGFVRRLWWLSAIGGLLVPFAVHAAVTLSSLPSPGAGQPGVTTLNITGSSFPQGTILPANVTVTIEPATAGSGPTVSTTPSIVTTLTGSTRRVTFQIPSGVIVAVPTAYLVSIAGTTTTSVAFASGNKAALTVNPPARLSSVSLNSGFVGQTLAVTITSHFTNFLQGATQASFGPGIAVGGGPAGAFGPVQVSSPTSVVAQVMITATALAGARTVTVKTGIQEASLVNAFTVASPTVTITAPAHLSFFHSSPIPVSGDISASTIEVLVNGVAASLGNQTFTAMVPLQEGSNTLTAVAKDAAGNVGTASVQVILDTTPPMVAITTPADGISVKTPSVTVSGTVDDATAAVQVNGVVAMVTPGTPAQFTATVALQEGPNLLTATATDAAGNMGTASVTVRRETIPPVVAITAPANGSLFTSSPITVTGTVNDVSATVVVNSVVAIVSGGTFTATGVPLVEGANPLTAIATDPLGNTSVPASVTVTLDTTAPGVGITAPTAGSTVSQNPPLIAVSYSDTGSGVQLASLTLTANGTLIAVDCQRTATSASCTPTAALSEGPITLVASIRDLAGNSASSAPVQFTLTLTSSPLAITITAPLEGAVLGASPIVVQGTVNDSTARAIVQNVIAQMSGTMFEATGVALAEGPNALLARARNNSGAQATATRSVILDTTPPVVTITSPPERMLLTTPTVPIVGAVSDATPVTCVVDSAAATVDIGGFSGTATLHQGQNVVTVTCQDAAGNVTSRQRTLYLDTTLLTVTGVDPGDGTTNVAPTTAVTVMFSEPVSPASVSITTFFLRADAAVLAAGLSLSSDGRSATLTPSAPLPAGTTIDVTVTTGVTDVDGNPLALAFTSRFSTAGTQAAPGVALGEVYDDTRSLPLAGATVDVLVLGTGAVLSSSETDTRGQYLLAPGQVNVFVRITRSGFTTVERQITTAQGAFAEVLDARLTPLSAPQTVTAVLGATITDAAGDVLTIPPGAFTAGTPVMVTALSQQGPRAPFPPGWTPLGIVDIATPEPFDPPATLALVERSGAVAGQDAVVARYDVPSAAWLALGWTALTLSMLAGSPLAEAQVFNSGSTGADGALTLTTPGTVIFDPASLNPPRDADGDHVYHFTTITIGAGVTVRLLATHVNGPVFWLASGDVHIDGIIDLNGADGQSDQDVTNNPRTSAIPGSGGFGGGLGLNGSLAATPGFGPGRGGGGCFIGGSGGHAGPGGSRCGDGGQAYGNDFLVPLIGGSGGGGASGLSGFSSGGGGGAGGGALLIASSTSITVNGAIRANGGSGGNCVRSPFSCEGGGGSGGAIHLLAPTLSVVGTLSAAGGSNPYGNGSAGRLRVESLQRTVTGTTTPIPVFATPFGIFLPPSGGPPSVRVVSVDGIPVPSNPTGSFTMPDVTINNTAPVTVAIEARNIPLGTVVQLYLFSETAPSMTVNSTPLAGALDHSIATATTTIPSGFSQGFVRATWTQ